MSCRCWTCGHAILPGWSTSLILSTSTAGRWIVTSYFRWATFVQGQRPPLRTLDRRFRSILKTKIAKHGTITICTVNVASICVIRTLPAQVHQCTFPAKAHLGATFARAGGRKRASRDNRGYFFGFDPAAFLSPCLTPAASRAPHLALHRLAKVRPRANCGQAALPVSHYRRAARARMLMSESRSFAALTG